MFEDATKLVSMVDMFSDNESFEEIATENVKYFLLPALLGTLTTKICGTDDRMHIVKVAEIYFVDFLKRVKQYGLTDVKIPEINSTDGKDDAGDSQSKSNKETITEMVGFPFLSSCIIIADILRYKYSIDNCVYLRYVGGIRNCRDIRNRKI